MVRLFDRFYTSMLGSQAVDLLVEGTNNAVSVLQYHAEKGFRVEATTPTASATAGA